MRFFRHTLILAAIGLLLIGLIGTSYATCLVTAGANCCEDDHECGDPICGEGMTCHCACGLSCILPTRTQLAPVFTQTAELTVEPSLTLPFDVAVDLYRPPKSA
ncbi:MAG TPA: hypothetical protein VNN55_01695 [bacterium]|nr:hypothetical protein [bacterium]